MAYPIENIAANRTSNTAATHTENRIINITAILVNKKTNKKTKTVITVQQTKEGLYTILIKLNKG